MNNEIIIGLGGLVLAGLTYFAGISRTKIQEKNKKIKVRKNSIQILSDLKYILENPPSNGFDYIKDTPFSCIGRLDKYLTDKTYFSEEELVNLKDARELLYQAKLLIDEVNNIDPLLKQNVNFRQRFPKIKENCINKINICLSLFNKGDMTPTSHSDILS
jgi:hypothetical protein